MSLSRLYPLFRTLLGLLVILLGLVITPLPIPVGLLLIIAGLTLMAYDNRFLKNRLRNLRKRHPKLSERLRRMESHPFFIIRDVARATDPARIEETD